MLFVLRPHGGSRASLSRLNTSVLFIRRLSHVLCYWDHCSVKMSEPCELINSKHRNVWEERRLQRLKLKDSQNLLCFFVISKLSFVRLYSWLDRHSRLSSIILFLCLCLRTLELSAALTCIITLTSGLTVTHYWSIYELFFKNKFWYIWSHNERP